LYDPDSNPENNKDDRVKGECGRLDDDDGEYLEYD